MIPLLLALLPSACSEEVTLPEVVSVSERYLHDENSRTVITGEEIARSQARNVGDLLKRAAGVDFGANMPGNAYAYIRGGSSSQTLVLIDGVRMNDPSSASRAFDFSALDLNQIESITVLKGPQSVSFGSDASAGVILIRTKSFEGTRMVEARAEGGSRKSQRTSVSAGTSAGRDIALQLNLSEESTAGHTSAAVAGGDRDGLDREGATMSAQIRASRSVRIDARSGIDYSRQELDDDAWLEDPNYVARVRELRNSILTRIEISPATELHLDLAHLDQRRSYDDLSDPVSPFVLDGIYRGRQSSIDLSAKTRADRIEFAGGAGLQREDFRLTSNTLGNSGSQSRSLGLFLQGRYALTPDLALDAGLRHDRPEDLVSRTTYRIGAEQRLTSALKAHTRYGTAFKAPSLSSRFDPLYGNAQLRPESSRSFEVGLTAQPFPKQEYSLTAFATRYHDLIGFNPVTFVSENTSSAESRGLELAAALREKSWQLRPHLTWLRAYDRDTRAELPRRARWKGGFVTEYDFSEPLSLELEWIAKTSRLNAAGSTLRASGYGLWNASLTWRFSSAWKAFVRGENLLGKSYQEVPGFTSFGRSGFVGVEATL